MGQERGHSRSGIGERSAWPRCEGAHLVPLQMVFYIEACESGSMMKHLPTDINGRCWEPWPLSQAG